MLSMSLFAQHPDKPKSMSIFNGKDLSGWHMDVPALDDDPDGKKPFIVRDGMLVSLGTPGGHLITDRQYQNYRLEVEYRFAGEPGNCGVLVHASTPRALYDMFPKSLEVQMQHKHAGDFWCIVEDIVVPDMEERRGPKDKWGIVEGKNRRIENLTDDSEKPLGEWNRMIIECRGNEVKVWVNDDLVNAGTGCSADKGQIAIQAEGSEVEFRKLVLTPLELKMAENSRPVKDTVGFAQYDWQMDSIYKRLESRIDKPLEEVWKAVIAPHDDYKYAGEVELQTLAGVKARTIILFGVAHKAATFNLENKLVFGSFTHWDAPYGKIEVSGLQQELLKRLPDDLWIVHDSMQLVEHSLEALNPFLQKQNKNIEIVPILVPYMNYTRMNEISESMGTVLAEIMGEKGWEPGKDLAIVISSDAVHYGDKDWGDKNMAPFGSDRKGNKKAVEHEMEIINTSLAGVVSKDKIRKFVNYTVQESDFREYKWTWCGRYSIPLGLLTANKLNIRINNKALNGTLVEYANSIDHEFYPVEDLGMGTTAPANSHHWVGYAGIGYK